MEVREVQGSLRGVQQATAKHKDLLHREQRKIIDLEKEIENIEWVAEQVFEDIVNKNAVYT